MNYFTELLESQKICDIPVNAAVSFLEEGSRVNVIESLNNSGVLSKYSLFNLNDQEST